MIMRILSVYDSKSCVFGQPVFDRSVGSAIRGFEEVCNDEKSNFCKFSSDYTLFEIGEFDDVSGELKALKPMRNLGTASSFKKLVAKPVEVVK